MLLTTAVLGRQRQADLFEFKARPGLHREILSQTTQDKTKKKSPKTLKESQIYSNGNRFQFGQNKVKEKRECPS